MRQVIEEALLFLIAAGMLSFLLPASTAWDLALSVTLALALIILLLVRGIGWHTVPSPYDLLIIAGAATSLVALAAFLPFLKGMLSAILSVLFAVYFLLLATLMHGFRVAPAVANGHDKRFMRGIAPIQEHEPPFANMTKKQVEAHAHMRRHGIEPIHEMVPPKPAKTPSKNFKKGVQPLGNSAPSWEKKR
jgi:hypothetical protein